MSEEEATPRPNPIKKTGPRPSHDDTLDLARKILWEFGIRPAYCAEIETLPISEILARIAWAKAWDREDNEGRTHYGHLLDADLLRKMDLEMMSRMDVFFLSILAWRDHIPVPAEFWPGYTPDIRR